MTESLALLVHRWAGPVSCASVLHQCLALIRGPICLGPMRGPDFRARLLAMRACMVLRRRFQRPGHAGFSGLGFVLSGFCPIWVLSYLGFVLSGSYPIWAYLPGPICRGLNVRASQSARRRPISPAWFASPRWAAQRGQPWRAKLAQATLKLPIFNLKAASVQAEFAKASID